MEETLVTYSTAKLANQKGFKKITEQLWRNETRLVSSHHGYDFDIPAPKQFVLQKWLRDEHEIDIEVELCTDHELIVCRPRLYESGYYTTDGYTMVKGFHSKYEEALEEGLQLALSEVKVTK